jgi:misacylated tRNA(Ala) deacylase
MGKDYDPRMHSAEHILNQTMVRMFNCGRSFSTHIEKKKSKCDYHFTRDLTTDEVREIERQVNTVVASDAVVREEFISRSEAETQFDLERLPDDAGERIRIIRIGAYDACPCIGRHVVSTHEIGSFHIVSSSYTDGVLRVRFKVGEEP